MPPTDSRPGFVTPMKAVLTAQRPAGPEWVFERKLDGIRCLAVKDGGRTRLYSRNELSLNDRYATLARALDADPADGLVIDGEAVAFVGGRDRFGGGEGGKLFYYVFDVLVAGGRDVRSLPLEERRATLEGLLRWRDPLRMTEQMTGDGAALLADACRDGWEGLIAKRVGTPYVSTRSRDWLKLKCTRSQELVIGGFTAPRGSRTDLGALLVGYFEGDRLRYAGKVGTGFTRATLRELSQQLAPLARETSPFEPEKGIPRAATWVEPRLVAQIAFMEWTSDGRLRHPSFLGLRIDKPAREVVREESYVHPVAVRRIVAYAGGDEVAASRDFYVEVLGMRVAMEDPVLDLQSPEHPAAEVIIGAHEMQDPQPSFGVDVGEPAAVDAAHAEAVRRGLRVVYPLTDEPWGVRRFFVEDPGGTIINVLAHIT